MAGGILWLVRRSGDQSVELLAGVSDELVLGVEVEFEGPRGGSRLDSISPGCSTGLSIPTITLSGSASSCRRRSGAMVASKAVRHALSSNGARANGGFRAT
jgi:hypothetical protein